MLLTYLNRDQIKDICNSFKLGKNSAKKETMINALVQNSNKQLTLTSLKNSNQILKERIKKKLGVCVKLSKETRDVLDKIHILFTLTNPELVMPNDIYWLLNRIHYEAIKYPEVKIDSVEIFKDNNDFDK